MKIVKILFFCFWWCFSLNISAMSFEQFKESIVGQNGKVVYDLVNPKLKGGEEAQIGKLAEHMAKEGHFGVRTSPLNRQAIRSTAKRWGTFFIKLEEHPEFYSSPQEQIDLVKLIWEAKSLTYAGDVPGAKNIVYLEGKVPNVSGVAFSNQEAERPGFIKGGDLVTLGKENELAMRLALSQVEPTEVEFKEDFQMAQIVWNAGPHIVDNITIRIKLDCGTGFFEFNTCFPRD